MKGARTKPTAANLRSWRILIVRSKGEYLVWVEAPDCEGGEAAAIKQIALDALKQFALDDDQRSRLLIRERRTASASQIL